MTLTSTLEQMNRGETLVIFSTSATESLMESAPSQREFERDGKSVLELKNVPVFRSGSFRDSIGMPHEFDTFAMESMVRNFDHLMAQKILTDIPVRRGHRGPFTNRMDELVGYVTAMRTEDRTAPHDGNEYTYLLADFEILDTGAQDKIKSGLWRNRSAEIGTYYDNRENEYGPAFLGVAYVDIPAVEGLNGFSKEAPQNVHFMMEDYTMTGVATPPGVANLNGTGAHAQQGAAPQFSFSLGGQKGITDFAAVQTYIETIEASNVELGNQVTSLTTERDELKAFKSGLFELEKDQFVTDLIKANKVLASQKDGLIALAKSLNDEQYEAWKSSYGEMPSQEVLGNYGHQSQEPSHRDKNSEDADAQKILFEQNKRTIEILKGAGQSDEKIKKSEAYAACVAHDSNFTL